MIETTTISKQVESNLSNKEAKTFPRHTPKTNYFF